jgi:flavodoxin
MKACVLYFSLLGNTRRFAEAISNSLGIPLFDLTASEPSIVEKFDLLILGTPVHGFSPARRVSSFVRKLPKGNGKKAIVFCTYAIYKGRTLKKLENMLAGKGYTTVLSVSKRGLKPSTQDFLGSINEIETASKTIGAR